MRLTGPAILAAACLLPGALAIPLGLERSTSPGAPADPETFIPVSSSHKTNVSRNGLYSMTNGSWSSFSTIAPTTSISLGPNATSSHRPSFTVVVESFTISLPQITHHSTPVSSKKVPSTTLSTVVATAIVPLNSTTDTVAHTFTITETALRMSLLSPTISVSKEESPSSAASKSLKSAASRESVLRSIFSVMGSSNSGLGPELPHAEIQTKRGMAETPQSMLTATFTLTIPTVSDVPHEPVLPTHSISMITAPFTITLPAQTKTTLKKTRKTTTCTVTITKWSSKHPHISLPTTSPSESTSSSKGTSSSRRLSASTLSHNNLRTYTLTTVVTISLGNSPKSTSLSSNTTTSVPSGTDAITVVYTLPGGPGRSSQIVTLTTDRPHPTKTPNKISSVSPSVSLSAIWPVGNSTSRGPIVTGTGSSQPRSSTILPPASRSGIWPVGNSTTVGPIATGTGGSRPRSSGFSWTFRGNQTTRRPPASGTGNATVPLSTNHVVRSTGIIIITKTMTLTQVHTTGHATSTGHIVYPHNNTIIIVGTGTAAPTGSDQPRFANVTASLGDGSSRPTHGAFVPRQIDAAAGCPPLSIVGRVSLNFDDFTLDADKVHLASASQTFANPDQRLQFSDGFERVLYSSHDMYVPSSLPAMLRFDQKAGNRAKIEALDGCFRFNLVSWNLGCDSIGTPCRFNISAFRRIGSNDVLSATRLLELPQADKVSGNRLQSVSFGTAEFSSLSAFTVQLEVDDSQAVSWWSDDLSISPTCDSSDFCAEPRTQDAAKTSVNKVAERSVYFWHRMGHMW